MADPQEVRFQATQWNVQAAKLLEGAAGSDPTYTMDDLKREIMTGTATLYAVFLGKDHLGYVVLWIENFGGTKELVIQSGKALARSDWAVRVTIPALEAFAKAHGCQSMRVHSTDNRMIGRLRRGGFHKAEIVLRKAWL